MTGQPDDSSTLYKNIVDHVIEIQNLNHGSFFSYFMFDISHTTVLEGKVGQLYLIGIPFSVKVSGERYAFFEVINS